jgi:hypothetical protein
MIYIGHMTAAVWSPIISATAVIVTIALAVWQPWRQRGEQKRFETWKGHTEELRNTMRKTSDLREKLESRSNVSLLTYEDMKSLRVDDIVMEIIKELTPISQRDSGLDKRLTLMLLRSANITTMAPADVDDFQHAIARVLESRSPQTENSETHIHTERLYRWIREFTAKAIHQRSILTDLMSDLKTLESDLQRRIDRS